VDDSGFWNLNLSSARTADLSAPFTYSATDSVLLEAQGAADGTASETVPVGTGSPRQYPTMILNGIPALALPLQTGWNLVALPLQPSAPLSAQQALDQINAQGGGANEIAGWSGGNWVDHLNGMGFNNFTLQPGIGYFVRTSQASLWRVTGTPFSKATVQLSPGWNLISMPRGTTYTASQLAASINAQGGQVLEIDRWNFGTWEAYIPGLPFNFNIVLGSGYFVKVGKASNWTP
jgi:hypothetical protein